MENRYNPYDWKAEIYRTPQEIYSALDSFGIYGKAIDSITVIGLAGTGAENTVYQNMLNSGIPLSQMKNYKDNALVPCSITVSEPVVITFEDNSTFEFQLMYGNQMKMSVNQLSAHIVNGVNNSNIDSHRMFAKIKGGKIEKLYINQYIKNGYRENSNSFKPEHSDFEFIFRCDDSPAIVLKSSYGNIACKLSLKSHYGQFKEMITFKECWDCFADQYNTEILWGHDTSSYFWIRPVESFKADYYNPEVNYAEDEISVEEGYVDSFLYYFLNKYYDAALPFHQKREYGERFEWYLTDNFYTYPVLEQMIAEIKEKSRMLAEDYDNPALDEMKKFYSIFDLGYPHKSALESETDEYEIFFDIDVDEEQFKKENIGVAIDFYNRFCWILQLMMEHNPDNEFISFMGP